MVHERQCLAFGLETRHDLPGIHTQLDELQGDPAANRFALLCQVYYAHPPLAEDIQDPVGPPEERNPKGTVQRREFRLWSRLSVRCELLAQGKFDDRLLPATSEEGQNTAKK